MNEQELYVELKDKLDQFQTSPLWEYIKNKVDDDICDIDKMWHLYEDGSKEMVELRTRKRSLVYLLNIEKMLGDNVEDLELKLARKDTRGVRIGKDYDVNDDIKGEPKQPSNYGVG